MFVLKKIRGRFNSTAADHELQKLLLRSIHRISWTGVRILLEQGANPNAEGLLIRAIKERQTDIVKLMLEKGVDRSLKDGVTGLDSIQYAAYRGHDDILDMLLEGKARSQDIIEICGVSYLRREDRRNASLCFFGTEDASVEDLFERWIEVESKCWNWRDVNLEKYQKEYFSKQAFSVLLFLLDDKEPSERLAEIICPLPWKNCLFFQCCRFGEFYPNHRLNACDFWCSRLARTLTLVKFLVKDCDCDMYAKNLNGQTFFHVLFDEIVNGAWNSNPYSTEESLLAKEQLKKDAAIFYLESGFHLCVSNSEGIRIRSLLEKEFPNLFPDRVPRLECLSAKVVVRAKIPYTEKVSIRLRKFIPLH